MKYSDLYESNENVLEESLGGSVGIFLTDLSSTISRMTRQKKSVDDMLPQLIAVANLKIYVENMKKIDKDRKVFLKLIGFRSTTPAEKLVPNLFKKRAPKKAGDLITTDIFGKKTLDVQTLNSWIIQIRTAFHNEELKLQDYMKSVATDANKKFK